MKRRSLAAAAAGLAMLAGAVAPATAAARPRMQVGISTEYGYGPISAYAGTNPSRIRPRFVQLVHALAGPHPVFRIGGDSTDWPYLTTAAAALNDRRFVALWQGVARATGARLIMGVQGSCSSFGPPCPYSSFAVAEREAGQIVRDFRPWLQAIEVGNEPEYYGTSWASYVGELNRYEAMIRGLGVRVDGPATGEAPWITRLPAATIGGLSELTYHAYALNNCVKNPADPQYPSVAHLKATPVSYTLRDVPALARLAHRYGRQLRIDELNSVTCRGKPGVSDSPYSRTWMLQALEQAQADGADAVNIHVWPGAPANQLFTSALTTLPAYQGVIDFEHTA